MKQIKILGTGCAKCKEMTANTEDAVSALNIDAQIEKVEDIAEIMQYNVLSTPVLVIDEDIKVKGRVPSVTEIKELLA